ncbi:MAG: DUF721 domain-containing protein [Gemmataceae bacterium]|nr:DUF721 domain-containing protein [Gemmataceae bacterium]
MIRRDVPERGPEPLKEVLSQLFTARGWGRRQARLHLERAWAASAGEEIAARTRVLALRRSTLDIEVDGPVLMQELASFHKRRLLTELRKRLPGTTLTDLKFRPGHFDPQE